MGKTLKEKTIKYLENIKKRAEKMNSDYPTCEKCGKEIKIKADLVLVLASGEKVIMENGIIYLCKEEGVYYICNNCEKKLKGGEIKDNFTKP